LGQIWLKNGSKIHPLDILVQISNVELRKGIVLVSRRCIMSVHVGQTFCDWPFMLESRALWAELGSRVTNGAISNYPLLILTSPIHQCDYQCDWTRSAAANLTSSNSYY
jgi:hypothetical protein